MTKILPTASIEQDVVISNLKIEISHLQSAIENAQKQLLHSKIEKEKLTISHHNTVSQHLKENNVLKSNLLRLEREFNDLKDLCDEKERSLQTTLIHMAIKNDEVIFNQNCSKSNRQPNNLSVTSFGSSPHQYSSKYGVKEVMRQKAINDVLRQEIHKVVTGKIHDVTALNDKVDELNILLNNSRSQVNDLNNEINHVSLRNADLEKENLQLYSNINNNLLVQLTNCENRFNELSNRHNLLNHRATLNSADYKKVINEKTYNIYKLHNYINKFVTQLKDVRKQMYVLQVETSACNASSGSLGDATSPSWDKLDGLPQQHNTSVDISALNYTRSASPSTRFTNSFRNNKQSASMETLISSANDVKNNYARQKQICQNITNELNRIINEIENDQFLFNVRQQKELIKLELTDEEKSSLDQSVLLNQSIATEREADHDSGEVDEVASRGCVEESEEATTHREITQSTNSISRAYADASMGNTTVEEYDAIWLETLQSHVKKHNIELISFRDEACSARQEVEDERQKREQLEDEIQNDSILLMNQLQVFQNKIDWLISENGKLVSANNDLKAKVTEIHVLGEELRPCEHSKGNEINDVGVDDSQTIAEHTKDNDGHVTVDSDCVLDGHSVDLQTTNNELLVTINNLTQELSVYFSKNSNLTQKLNISQLQIAAMKQQVEEANVENNKNSLQYEHLLAQNAESHKQKENYEVTISQLNSQLGDMQNRINDYTARLITDNQTRELLSGSFQNSLLQIDSLNSELYSKDMTIADLTSQLSSVAQQLETAKAAYEDCILQLSAISDRLDASEKSKAQAQLQISALNVQLEAVILKHSNVSSINSSRSYNNQPQVNIGNDGISMLPLHSATIYSSKQDADSKIAAQVKLLQNKLKEAEGSQDQQREQTHQYLPYDSTLQHNISSTSHESTGVFKTQDYSQMRNQSLLRTEITIDNSELKRLITRCESLEKQIKSMPASLKIAQAEKRVLESKLSKLITAAEIKFAEKESETDRVRQELQAFLAVQMAEKESLNKKIHAQATTIHQLTHHLNMLQSQHEAHENSRREDATVLEFMKTHPSYNLNVTPLDRRATTNVDQSDLRPWLNNSMSL